MNQGYRLLLSGLIGLACALAWGFALGHTVVALVAFVIAAGCGATAAFAEVKVKYTRAGALLAYLFHLTGIRVFQSLILIWLAQFAGAFVVGVISGQVVVAVGAIALSILAGGLAALVIGHVTEHDVAQASVAGPLTFGWPTDDRCWLCHRDGAEASLEAALKTHVRAAPEFGRESCLVCGEMIREYTGDFKDTKALYTWLNSPPPFCPHCRACRGCARPVPESP